MPPLPPDEANAEVGGTLDHQREGSLVVRGVERGWEKHLVAFGEQVGVDVLLSSDWEMWKYQRRALFLGQCLRQR